MSIRGETACPDRRAPAGPRESPQRLKARSPLRVHQTFLVGRLKVASESAADPERAASHEDSAQRRDELERARPLERHPAMASSPVTTRMPPARRNDRPSRPRARIRVLTRGIPNIPFDEPARATFLSRWRSRIGARPLLPEWPDRISEPLPSGRFLARRGRFFGLGLLPCFLTRERA